MPTDLEIASSIKPKPIIEIAQQLNIPSEAIIPYGKYIAKLPLSLIDAQAAEKSHLILVSGITPTPTGEGKTTLTIGLSQAFYKLGAKAIAALREPSLGPVFGLKGGATGGGYAQVIPMENINLHFTGDLAAIEKAHNLLAAIIDNEFYYENSLGIVPSSVRWKRVIDINDRALRSIITGLESNGILRQTGFDITAASEVMAILCLSHHLQELKQKLGSIIVGSNLKKEPIYVRQLEVAGAMAVLLKDALMPNLVQTLEATPVLIHGGPFANVAHGSNSIIATKMGLSLAEYVITEAGFGFDLGGEKFLNIKCRYANLKPRLVVLVATLKALKYHGGAAKEKIQEPNLEALQIGFENLKKHIQNVKKFGLEPFVAINHFYFDTPQELEWLVQECDKLNVVAHVCRVWERGGEGALELAKSILEFCKQGTAGRFRYLYDCQQSVEQKISIIAREIYGAQDVEFSAEAQKILKLIYHWQLAHLPICIAKTQYSFSDNPSLGGVCDQQFRITIQDIEIAAGAGFIIPIAGNLLRMPGLPKKPAAKMIDIDNQGNVAGLF
ncbi:MAG: formate--tetrahydrofolate ligase [Bacteroidia bacterium]|nr:formate--tetrahydrofolate ligase [Bacteroidia bacterium]MDW8159565.1 formate--tetrahydrofolate ligase [Bacteroidia bacterium]